ncbi:MAG: LysE family transporter [Shewanella sp.]|nr:LysE family transporter [Shewanella sp.]
MWLSAHLHNSDLDNIQIKSIRNINLYVQGLLTALTNPKLWIFMLSILPAFIDHNNPIAPQLSLLLIVVLSSEFSLMVAYAAGGNKLKEILSTPHSQCLLYRFAGTAVCIVGIWLAFK